MDLWQQLLRTLATALGMECGPDTQVRLVFELFPRGGGGLLVSLGLILLLLLGFLALRGVTGSAPRRPVFLCGLLRGLALLLPALIILGPALITSREDRLEGTTLVLVDSSWSMRRADPGAEVSRIGQVNQLLGRQEGRFLADLARRNRVQAFSFASAPTLVELTPGSWQELDARGPATNLAAALNRVLEEEKEGRIAAALLFTDGRWNEGGEPAEIAADLERRSIPLYLIGVGDPTPRPVIHLAKLDAPERAFSRDPFAVTAELEVPPGVKEVVATLWDQVDEAEPEKLETRRVAAPKGGRLQLTFRIKPSQAGTHRFSLRARAAGGAAEEEAQGRVVVEIASRPARVLLVAGSPTYEYRALVRLFTRDKTVDLTCWLQSASRKYPQRGNTPCRELPRTREELRPFHAVILVDPDPLRLDQLFARNLARAVQEEGVGLAYLAGEKFSLDFFNAEIRREVTGPLVTLLPAAPDQEMAEIHIGMGRILTQPWPLMVTPQGRRDRLMALDGRPERVALLFGSLPGMYWNYPFKQPSPGAHILAVHPGENTLHRMQSGPRPLLAWHHVGAGRVLLAAVDETWRWRSVAEQTWNRFWVRLARFLAENKLTADRTIHRLVTSRRTYEVGTEIAIIDKLPLEAKVKSLEATVTRRGGEEPTRIQLTPPPGRPRDLEGTFTPTEPGLYRVSLPALKDALPARFEVREPVLESPGPLAQGTLQKLATAAGGTYLSLAQAGALPERIQEVTEILVTESNPRPLWDNLVFLLLAVALLAGELLLRKLINLP